MPSSAIKTDVIEPRNVNQLSEALASTDEPILIQGGGTRLSFGNVHGSGIRRLSTRKLNNVLHYEPADLTIAVEAGITVAELNSVLGEHNQHLPIDSPRPDVETVGGMFAAGLAGPRRLRHGSLRDWVLGLEVAGPDGIVTKSGGMVVKNVTGYDLPRLHYGMHGSFGIVTRINLKVLPKEEASRSVVMTFPTPADAFAAAIAVIGSQLEPTSVTVDLCDGWTVRVSCDGPVNSIDWHSGSIVEAVESIVEPGQISVQQGNDSALETFFKATDCTSGQGIARLSVLASRQAGIVERLAALTGTTICADPGSGLIYAASTPTIEWREAIRSIAPDAVFLSLPDELKHDIDVFGPTDRQTRNIFQRLKHEHDPSLRLNPGRFIRQQTPGSSELS